MTTIDLSANDFDKAVLEPSAGSKSVKLIDFGSGPAARRPVEDPIGQLRTLSRQPAGVASADQRSAR